MNYNHIIILPKKDSFCGFIENEKFHVLVSWRRAARSFQLQLFVAALARNSFMADVNKQLSPIFERKSELPLML